MRAILTSYATIGIEGVPVDLAVDGDQASVVETETSRCLHSFRLETTGSVASAAEHTVNTRTSPLCKRAPERIVAGLIFPILPDYPD
jgi:hypothetical protein